MIERALMQETESEKMKRAQLEIKYIRNICKKQKEEIELLKEQAAYWERLARHREKRIYKMLGEQTGDEKENR